MFSRTCDIQRAKVRRVATTVCNIIARSNPSCPGSPAGANEVPPRRRQRAGGHGPHRSELTDQQSHCTPPSALHRNATASIVRVPRLRMQKRNGAVEHAAPRCARHVPAQAATTRTRISVALKCGPSLRANAGYAFALTRLAARSSHGPRHVIFVQNASASGQTTVVGCDTGPSFNQSNRYSCSAS